MIRIIEVTASRQQKVNLGNYESADVGVFVKAELTTGDMKEFSTAAKLLADECDAHIYREVQSIRENNGGKK